MNNVKIKWVKAASRFCVSYDENTNKKTFRRQEWFNLEDKVKAEERVKELKNINL